MSAHTVDLFVSGDLGLWALKRVPKKSVGWVFCADKPTAALAAKRGFNASRRDPHSTRFKPSPVGLSVHYPRLIKRKLLGAYRKIYNLHPGFLPWGRGYYPVFWALWEGTPAGATLHEMSEGVDEGPIVGQIRVRYTGRDTGGSLHRRVRLAEKKLFMRTWPLIVGGRKLRPVRQPRKAGSVHRKKEFFDLKRCANTDEMSTERFERLVRCFRFPGHPGLERRLAILGGRPAFKNELHVGRPNIGDRRAFMRRLERILDSRWLTNNGPCVREFEAEIARIAGVRNCVAVCNATIALQIAIRALELKGEVIVPSFTFVATAHALQWEEIRPVFCDIDEKSFTIDPACVERLITPRTTGIIGVHLWGRPCAVDALSRIAKRHRLKLLFDAAHAFGCSYKGKSVGRFGDAEVLSFHATKFLNTFEGGAILTDNDALAKKIRLMKNFGFAGNDNVIYLGTNGKMSEVSAAMGLSGLESMDKFIAVNRRNYRAYDKALKGIPGVSLVPYDEKERSNYQYVTVLVDQDRAGLSRDHVMTALMAERVLARRYFYPGCHRMEPYKSRPRRPSDLRVTERASGRTLLLPTGTAVGTHEIAAIGGIIRAAVAQAPRVSKAAAKKEASWKK